MAALYACGFNAHGQISAMKVDERRVSTESGIADGDVWGQSEKKRNNNNSNNDNKNNDDDDDGGGGGGGADQGLIVQDDVLRLQKMCAASAVKIVFAGWSESAVILKHNTLYLQGNCTGSTIRVAAEDAKASCGYDIDVSTTHSYFGDYNGAIGCLTGDGKVLILEQSSAYRNKVQARRERNTGAVLKSLKPEIRGDWFDNGDNTIRLGLVALAGNDRVVAIPLNCCQVEKEAPEYCSERPSGIVIMYEFETLKLFKSWVTTRDVNKRKKGMKRLQINHGQPIREKDERVTAVQLLATTTSFAVLLSDGSVYTWGDPRHSSTLGRNTLQNTNEGDYKDSDSENVPAHRPGQITALGGLRVRKIIGKGWYMAALTEDKEVFVWGGRPGNDWLMRDLIAMKTKMAKEDDIDVSHRSVENIENIEETGNGNSDDEEVHLLQIPSVQDVLDVGIGCNHLIVLARMENGEEKVMAFGMGENGQLGLGRKVEWSSDFLEVEGFNGKNDINDAKRNVMSVWCGDYNTFIITG